MFHFRTLIVLGVFTCLTTTEAACQTSDWHSLPAGPHPVGFQVFNRYDYGRIIKPKYNYDGTKNEGNRSLPMQISMWYPAESGSGASMLYQDFVFLTLQRHDLAPLTDEKKATAIDVVRFPAEFGAGIKLSDEELKKIYAQPARSVKDAPVLTGSYPVIIAAGDGGPGHHMFLFEHLASNGYIVLFTPSISRDATRQVNAHHEVIGDRISNIEYLLAFARTLPSANMDKLGLIGVNFDGFSTLLYQMKSREANAVVTIDGWEGKSGSEHILKESMHYKPVAFTVPYFTIQQDEKDPGPSLALSQRIYNELIYADRYYYVFKDFGHAYLLGSLYPVPGIPPAARQAYHYSYVSIGKFFDAYLNRDEQARQFINTLAAENALPAGIAKTEVKRAGLSAVPSAAELETMIMAGEFDRVREIAIKALHDNPGLTLTEAGALNLYNFRFSRMNKPENCIAVRELGVLFFQKSAQAMAYLGDAQMQANRTDAAKQSYRRALDMLDKDPELNEDQRSSLRSEIAGKLKQ